ncbi:ATP-grasp domain-containing protein [Streptomyces sp. NPDC050388]|uniref:ATP-grasp domain-containing protein n=1 Tax=Streptomyces sp. NPDC050388 TaxID=3155781 RepID=UPI003446F4AF
MSDQTVLVIGWQPKFRPFVLESLKRRRGDVVVACEHPLPELPEPIRGQMVVEGLHSTPSEHVARLVEYGSKEAVRGVVTFNDELASLSAAVAEGLGLPGPAPEAVATAMGKAASRRALASAGVPSTSFTSVPSSRQAEVPAGYDFPLVVKPGCLSGSRGVFRVDSPEEFHRAAALSARLGASGPLENDLVLIEQYIDGHNLTVELAMDEQDVHVLAVCDAEYDYEPVDGLRQFQLINMNFPSRRPREEQEEACGVAVAAARACGLTSTMVHVELRVAADGVRVIEVNPRSGGAFIPEMVRLCSGVDYAAVAVELSQQRLVPPPKAEGGDLCGAAALGYFRAPDHLGDIGGRKLHRIERLWEVPDERIHRLDLWISEGSRIDPSLPCLGQVIATGKTPMEAVAAAKAVTAGLRLELKA